MTKAARDGTVERDAHVATLRTAGETKLAEVEAEKTFLDSGSDRGGELAVVEWTGPGPFTDSVFR